MLWGIIITVCVANCCRACFALIMKPNLTLLREKITLKMTTERADAVVVGSGPAGLTTAIMLARRGTPKIRLYDQLPEPPASMNTSVWGTFRRERSYNVGLSGRGQQVLERLEALDGVKKASMPMKVAKVWTPETPVDMPIERNLVRDRYQTICLERDRLSSCLLEDIRQKYSDQIELKFSSRCVGVCWAQLWRRG